jgi:hypothetical protein
MRRVHQADDRIVHVRIEDVMDDEFRLRRQRPEIRRRHDRFASSKRGLWET